jgi:hypothetical protein
LIATGVGATVAGAGAVVAAGVRAGGSVGGSMFETEEVSLPVGRLTMICCCYCCVAAHSKPPFGSISRAVILSCYRTHLLEYDNYFGFLLVLHKSTYKPIENSLQDSSRHVDIVKMKYGRSDY